MFQIVKPKKTKNTLWKVIFVKRLMHQSEVRPGGKKGWLFEPEKSWMNTFASLPQTHCCTSRRWNLFLAQRNTVILAKYVERTGRITTWCARTPCVHTTLLESLENDKELVLSQNMGSPFRPTIISSKLFYHMFRDMHISYCLGIHWHWAVNGWFPSYSQHSPMIYPQQISDNHWHSRPLVG